MDAENAERKCRVCGCTDMDCSGCIARTGEPCYWVEEDLCSACHERKVVLRWAHAKHEGFTTA